MHTPRRARPRAHIFALVTVLTRSLIIGILLWSLSGLPLHADFMFRLEAGRGLHQFTLSVDGGQPYNLNSQIIEEYGGSWQSFTELALPDSLTNPGTVGELTDLTAGQSAQLSYDTGSARVEIGAWTGSDPRLYILHYDQSARLVLLQADGSYRLLGNPNGGPGVGWPSGQLRWEYSTLAPPGNFRIVDLTYQRKAPWGEADVALSSWEPLDGSEIVTGVKTFLGIENLGERYTIHLLDAAGQEQLQSVVATLGLEDESQYLASALPGAYSVLTFVGGVGMNFWITRDADNYMSSSYGVGLDETGAARVQCSFPPLPRDTQTLYVRQSLASQQLYLQQAGGLFPLVPAVPSNDGYIEDYTMDGQNNTFYYTAFTCQAQSGSSFWVVDGSGQPQTSEENATWVYGGWQWIGGSPAPPPPEPEFNLTFTIPSSRGGGGSFSIVDGSGSSTLTISGVNSNDTFSLFDPWTEHERTYATATYGAQTPAPHWGPWFVRDDQTGDLRQLDTISGPNYWETWFLAPQPAPFQISLTRWYHDLRVRCSDGSEFPISREFVQGTITPDLVNQTRFDSSLFFEATGSFIPGLVYWVWDATTGEASPQETTSLQTWTAVRPAWDLAAVLNPNHTVSVSWTGAGGAKAFDIERGVAGSWVRLGSVRGEINETPYSFVDSFPVPGVANSYRIFTRFTDTQSAVGESVNVIVPRFTDLLVGIPLYEQDGIDGLFVPRVASRNPWAPVVGTGVTKQPGGGAPAILGTTHRLPPPPPSFMVGVHRHEIPNGFPNQTVTDEEPDGVDIQFIGTELQHGLIVERRKPNTTWQERVRKSGTSGLAQDPVDLGEVYYYRCRTWNSNGVSQPTRMVRWVPPVYFESKYTEAWAQVERYLYPSEVSAQTNERNTFTKKQTGPVSDGDALNYLPGYPGSERSVLKPFRGAVAYQIDYSDWNYAYQQTIFLKPSSLEAAHLFNRGRTNIGGTAKISYLFRSVNTTTPPYSPTYTLETMEWQGATFLEFAAEQGKSHALRETPRLRGTDSFSVPSSSYVIDMDYRRSVDWGAELYFEENGPANQVEIKSVGTEHAVWATVTFDQSWDVVTSDGAHLSNGAGVLTTRS